MADSDWGPAGGGAAAPSSAPAGDAAWGPQGGAAAPSTPDAPRSLFGISRGTYTGEKATPKYWTDRGMTPPDSVLVGAGGDPRAKKAATQIARTLGAVYAPLSPTGPLVGALIQDRQGGYGGLGPHMFKMVNDAADTIGASPNPKGVVRAVEEAQANYGPTSSRGLQEERRQGGTVGTVADAALHHPKITGAVTAGLELFNPTGALGGWAGDGVKYGLNAVGLGGVGKAFKTAGQAAADANPFDRYSGVRAGAGDAGENLAHTMESRIRGGSSAAHQPTIDAFGDPRASNVKAGAFNPDKMVEGLTREEQREVENRSIQLPPNSPYTPYIPNRSLDASVLKRTGASLDDRAAGIRKYMRGVDERMVQHGVMDPEDLYESGTFWPTKQYHDRPVFSEDFMQRNPQTRDGVVALSDIGAPKNITPGASGAGAVSRAFARGKKTQPPNYLLPADALHPNYLPAHQIYEHYSAAEKAIEQARALKLAEQTKVPNLKEPTLPDLPARVPKQYQREVFGQLENLGEGVEGRNAATNLVNRQRQYEDTVQAANDVGRPDLLGKSRSPFKSVTYLSGLARGRRGVQGDLSNAFRTLRPDEIARAGADTGKVANELDAVGRKQAMNAESLNGALQSSEALQAGLRSNVGAQKDVARGVLADLQQAQRVVKDQFHATGNRELDDYLYDAAKERGDRPAYAERFTNTEDAAGNYDRTVRTSGNANRAKGYSDSMFTPADVTAARKAASEAGVTLSIKEADDLLHQAYGFMRNRDSDLRALVDEHGSGPNALQNLAGAVKQHLAQLDQSEGRVIGGQETHDTLNPAIRGAANDAADLGTRAPDLAGRLRSSQDATKLAVQRAGGRIASQRSKVSLELDQLANKLVSAKNDEAGRRTIEQRVRQLMQQRTLSASEEVDRDWGKLPKGYTKEEELQLGARDSNAYGLQEDLGKLLKEPLADARGRDVPRKFEQFMHAFATLNNLTKTGIIAVPTVHVIGNLGSQFLAKYKDFGAFGRVLAGKTKVTPDDVTFMRESGALPGSMGNLQGVYEHGPAETMTRNRSELKAPARLDQYVSQKFWEPNQKLVFGHFEEGYAWEAMQKELKKTAAGRAELAAREVGPESMRAAREVRKFAGDYNNISGFERKLGLNGIMYFYPWLKTAIAFWTKHGILDPKSTIVAPERGIQTNNDIEGYDDPTEPWTATNGREKDGSYRRTSLPYAGRITEEIGRTAALPIDALEYPFTGPAQFKADLKSPFKMIANRLNPFGQAIEGGMENLTGVDRGDEPAGTGPIDRLKSVGAAAANSLIGPFSRLQQLQDDPVGAGLGLAGGGFSYSQPNGISRHDLAQYKALIELYRSQGNDQQADELERELYQTQSP